MLFLLFLLSLADGPAVEAGGSGGEQLNKKPKMMMKMANKTPSSTSQLLKIIILP